jgi:hypothetical protein
MTIAVSCSSMTPSKSSSPQTFSVVGTNSHKYWIVYYTPSVLHFLHPGKPEPGTVHEYAVPGSGHIPTLPFLVSYLNFSTHCKLTVKDQRMAKWQCVQSCFPNYACSYRASASGAEPLSILPERHALRPERPRTGDQRTRRGHYGPSPHSSTLGTIDVNTEQFGHPRSQLMSASCMRPYAPRRLPRAVDPDRRPSYRERCDSDY